MELALLTRRAASTRRTGVILFRRRLRPLLARLPLVSKRDRRSYFRFVPIQLAEGRRLAERLGIDPDRPDSFAFVVNGRAYIKSEAALRIAREFPRWQWTWVFHFIPRAARPDR